MRPFLLCKKIYGVDMKVLGLAHYAGRNCLICESAWRFPRLLVTRYAQAGGKHTNCKQGAVHESNGLVMSKDPEQRLLQRVSYRAAVCVCASVKLSKRFASLTFRAHKILLPSINWRGRVDPLQNCDVRRESSVRIAAAQRVGACLAAR